MPDPLRTVILCGGRGTRAYPLTVDMPKPLLPVGDTPILRYVMDIYARQGFTDFVLAAGYMANAVQEFATTVPDAWTVEVVDTGEATDTADRIRGCRDLLGDTFFATYGDGLGNVDLHALLARHQRTNALGTVTSVPLPSQYGTVEIDGDGWALRFLEKPVLHDHWINAGFLVVTRSALDTTPGANLERDLLPGIAELGRLQVYRHSGFWRSMDTHKDMAELTVLAESEGTPWLRSPAPEFSLPVQPASSART